MRRQFHLRTIEPTEIWSHPTIGACPTRTDSSPFARPWWNVRWDIPSRGVSFGRTLFGTVCNSRRNIWQEWSRRQCILHRLDRSLRPTVPPWKQFGALVLDEFVVKRLVPLLLDWWRWSRKALDSMDHVEWRRNQNRLSPSRCPRRARGSMVGYKRQ